MTSQKETDPMQDGVYEPVPSVSDPIDTDEFVEYEDFTKYTDDLASVNGGLTAEEIDTLGEVGNICMGAAATAMYRLIDRRVEITAPRVAVLQVDELLLRFPLPVVLVEIDYIEGLRGRNILLLDEADAAMLTDILMGGEGIVEEPIELGELHMSAINEIMNQMIGSSATVLAQLIGHAVNISTPMSYHMYLSDDISKIGTADTAIVITFDMEIDGLLSSRLVQIMPYDVGCKLSEMLVESVMQTLSTPPIPANRSGIDFSAPSPKQPYVPPIEKNRKPPSVGVKKPVPGDLVDVRPMRFPSFDNEEKPFDMPPNGIHTINNIPLTVAAELGTTTKKLSEVLDFRPGVIFTLNKTAGDPVEILVNKKRIARGEVVIIDDNYGVRITELPED